MDWLCGPPNRTHDPKGSNQRSVLQIVTPCGNSFNIQTARVVERDRRNIAGGQTFKQKKKKKKS